jgi:hypothetical protein
MSTIPEVLPPLCPHCAKDLPVVEKYAWGGDGGDPFRIVCVLCPHCRKVLQFWCFPNTTAPMGRPS